MALKGNLNRLKIAISTGMALFALVLSACNLWSQVQASKSPETQENTSAFATPGDELVRPLATAYAQQPAAGICGEAQGPVATLTVRPDIPDPRCQQVRADQFLKVVNARSDAIRVRIGDFEVYLEPGEAYQFEEAMGMYLAPGVHALQVEPCCGGELWLSGE